MRSRNVGCLKTVPDAHCRGKQTANAYSHEEKCIPAPNVEQAIEENLDLEPRLSGAKLTTVEVANHLKVHPSMVAKMAKRGELPGFKIGNAWRFDHARIEEWMGSRMQGAEG